jgi:hypothetical protein
MGPVVFLLVPTRYQINHDMNQAKEQSGMERNTVFLDHEYLPLVVSTSRSFPRSRLITRFVTRLTRRVPLVEQELLTLPEFTLGLYWGSCYSHIFNNGQSNHGGEVMIST